MKFSAANATIGDFLNPDCYRENYMNRAMDNNEGIYSLIHPFPGCGMGMNYFHFRQGKYEQEIIHTYFRGELIKIECVNFIWNEKVKCHDKDIIIVDQTSKPLDKCGNPAILRLFRYLSATRNKSYKILNESSRSITLLKRHVKGNKNMFTISKWTGKLLGKHNRE